MTIQIEKFINLTIITFLLFLSQLYVEKIIVYVGKSITMIIKNFVKIVIKMFTIMLFYLWTMILGTIIKESLNFYINNNYQLNLINMKNITMYSFDKIIYES